MNQQKQVKSFSAFGIKRDTGGMVGDKISITQVLNLEVIVHSYQIQDSKFGKGPCLYLQIELNGAKRVVFVSSKGLIEMIQKVNKDDFPFKTVIRSDNKRLEFT